MDACCSHGYGAPLWPASVRAEGPVHGTAMSGLEDGIVSESEPSYIMHIIIVRAQSVGGGKREPAPLGL